MLMDADMMLLRGDRLRSVVVNGGHYRTHSGFFLWRRIYFTYTLRYQVIFRGYDHKQRSDGNTRENLEETTSGTGLFSTIGFSAAAQAPGMS